MAYADAQTLQQRSAGLAGAAIAHAAIGSLIIVGLTVKTVVQQEDEKITSFDVKVDIPPPPAPPEPQPKPDTAPIENTVVSLPQPLPRPSAPVLEDTIPELPAFDGSIILKVPPTPIPSGNGLGAITPMPAAPNNDPARWVTDADYKSRWIREGLSGLATFQLDINAKGRVENCSITRSSGHEALDTATCSLITKRARFKPAKANDGSVVSGVYASSIRWQLPD